VFQPWGAGFRVYACPKYRAGESDETLVRKQIRDAVQQNNTQEHAALLSVFEAETDEEE